MPSKMPTDHIQVSLFSLIYHTFITYFQIAVVVLCRKKLHVFSCIIFVKYCFFSRDIQYCGVTYFLRYIVGDVQNGHAQFSHSLSEEEVPITMKSNADFTAVQQKLAVKKPFYKGISSVFK